MAFNVDLRDAEIQFPQYSFVNRLTPSAQKAAFHVTDSTGRNLCLKIISPDYATDRLHREIEAMQQISHTNVVKLLEYTFSSTPGARRHFIVEEFIEGNDLDSHIGRPWERARVSRVFAQLMDGLQQLNVKHIVHRDLKPSNIRLKPNDTPVIIDFGLARHLTLSDLTETSAGAQIGTPSYFAPEQFEGTKYDIDHRTDLFAAGVIIYQALTGLHPFYAAGMTRLELQHRVCSNVDLLNAAQFTNLPRPWQVLVGKLLQKERAKRVNSAAIAATLLRNLENV